jgi:hypothetical protein
MSREQKMPAAQVFAVALAVPKTKAGASHLDFEMWETTKARESLLLPLPSLLQLPLLLPLPLLFYLSFPKGICFYLSKQQQAQNDAKYAGKSA